MIPQRFNEIVKRRLQLIDETLGFKGQEYAGGQEDRLHNFKLGAEIQQITRPSACAATGPSTSSPSSTSSR